MRNQLHLWNLRRIFRRQFVVCVGSPSRPEARIATQVIPSQSSRRTFRGPSDADLATWSWVTTGISSHETQSGHSSGIASTFKSKVEGFDSCRASRKRHDFSSPSTSLNNSSGVIARHNLVQPYFPL